MLLKKLPFFACYDGTEDDPPVVDPPGGKPPEVTTQDQLNAVLKREKEKFRKEREKLVAQLEDHKQNTRLSTEQKEALESQIEELRTQTMTADERARHQAKKLETDFTAKLEAANTQSKTWEGRYQNLQIGYEITRAAASNDVLPGSVELVESFLRPKTRLVENVDEDGQPSGTYTAKVKFSDTDKDGKPIVLDLPVADAVKRMKELPEKYGSLFKGNANGGLGGNTGTPGKKPNPAKMTTAEYMAQRKKDPASLGLT